MTNEELVTDLKQFITATISQSEQRLRTELRAEIESVRSEIGELRTDTTALVANAVETLGKLIDADKTDVKRRLDEHDEALSDHSRRIQRLEHRAA